MTHQSARMFQLCLLVAVAGFLTASTLSYIGDGNIGELVQLR